MGKKPYVKYFKRIFSLSVNAAGRLAAFNPSLLAANKLSALFINASSLSFVS